MKALTISQPYASLIAGGEKIVENRTWPTAYRGPLAIHAGKGTQYLTARELREYPTSVIVATCELVTCLDLKTIFEQHDEATADTLTIQALPPQVRRELEQAGLSLGAVLAHQHCEGPVAWVVTEIRGCEPVPCTGRQGLWDLPDDLLRSAVDQLAF